jgi:hypothetical protein
LVSFDLLSEDIKLCLTVSVNSYISNKKAMLSMKT